MILRDLDNLREGDLVSLNIDKDSMRHQYRLYLSEENITNWLKGIDGHALNQKYRVGISEDIPAMMYLCHYQTMDRHIFKFLHGEKVVGIPMFSEFVPRFLLALEKINP